MNNKDSKAIADAALSKISTDYYTKQPDLRGLSPAERAAVERHYDISTDYYTGQPRVSKK
jgi:hypothetical protein